MIRGLLGGLLFGSGVSVVLLAGASMVMPLPEAVGSPGSPTAVGQAEAPTSNAVETSGEVPAFADPQSEAPDASLPPAETGDQEQQSGVSGEGVAPQSQSSREPIVVDTIAEDVVNPVLREELSPTPDARDEAPQSPQLPSVADAVSGTLPTAPESEPIDLTSVAVQEPVTENAPPIPHTPAPSPDLVLDVAQPSPPPVQTPLPQDVSAQADAAPSVPDASATPQAPVADQAPDIPEDPEPELVTLRPLPSSGAGIGNSAGNLITRRAEAEAAEAEEEVLPEPVEAPRTALERYARPFEITEAKPLMAMVLMDRGSDAALDLEQLSEFPYPLSIAIDATLIDGARRAEDYRAQGFEVMALVDLPEAATAADVETSLSAAVSNVPQSIGLLEGDVAGLQDSRSMSEQVTRIAQEDGLGVVWRPQGLDTARKLAAREGVPTRTLFRDFDGNGQNSAAIRRFLDQAAFRAGQEGAVIMVGRLQEETIKALLVWGLQDRASRVTLAPVSAILLNAPPQQ